VNFAVLPQTFRYRDRYQRPNQGRASLEPDFPGKFLALLLRHVADKGMDERIREVGNAGKIKHDRFQAIPDAFDPESTELVGKVPIGEKIAKFGEHVEFQFREPDM